MKKAVLFVFVILVLAVAFLMRGFLFGVGETYTDSMEPTFVVGKSITITNRFDKSPDIGDVVVFQCLPNYRDQRKCNAGVDGAGPYISHRLVGVAENGCMTIVGDNPKYNWNEVPCYMPEEINVIGTEHILFTLK